MRKIVLTYGIIAGIIVSGLMYLNMPKNGEKMNFESGQMLGYITMIVALSTIFFAVKSYRDKYHDGIISFGKGFLMGLYITLVAGCIYAIGWEIYYRNFAPDFMAQYSDFYAEKMKSDGLAEQEIKLKMDEMKTMTEYYKNPVFRFGMTILEILPVGIIISLISAAILKKRTATTVN